MANAETENPSEPSMMLTVPRLPLGSRIKYGLSAFLLQNVLLGPALFIQDLKDSFSPPEARPDIVKTYPCRKSLPIRIFFPESYSRESGEKLPVLFTVHGGGFVIGRPHDNDAWNRSFASKHNMLVIGLNYAKAPANPFPGPIYDLEALLGSAIADTSLPIDAERVAMAGWSAGGNLVLAAAQLESVKARVKAVVPFYPVVDFVPSTETKTHLRRYKPELGGFRGKEKDYLLVLAPTFNWSYLPPGQSAKDPLLSPFYAPPESLPDNIFLVGCELDLLSHEAWRMAAQLAGRKVPMLDQPVGREEAGADGELVLDDERFHFEEVSEGKRYRWLLVPDSVHGFDQKIEALARDPTMLKDKYAKTDKVIDLVGKWLLDGPLKV